MVRPIINGGLFRYEKINVESQSKDTGSLLNHIKNLTSLSKQHNELGEGAYTVLQTDPESVWAIAYDYKGNSTIILINLSEEPTKVTLTEYQNTKLTEFFSDGVYKNRENAYDIPLNGYGYRWFEIERKK